MARRDDFELFFRDAEPRLRAALSAWYGPDEGREATCDALSWAWEHWDALVVKANPVGYLFRVGQSKARRYRRIAPRFPVTHMDELPDYEPGLIDALRRLTAKQRAAVVLIDAYQFTRGEAAAVLGLKASTVQNHRERGLRKLSKELRLDQYTDQTTASRLLRQRESPDLSE